MDCKIDPGLYAIGDAGPDSPVLVTANYKPTFDLVRKSCHLFDAWLLVLDTKGINVWCAAGKGTFGTNELVRQIELTGLADIVNHRKLILPQLGAPGIAAHLVKQQSGFKAIYGPVRAKDIETFIGHGFKASEPMRTMGFPLKDRISLIPLELVQALKYLPVLMALWMVIRLLTGQLFVQTLGYDLLMTLTAFLTGTVFFQILLPWLPFRSFAANGALAGIIFLYATSLLLNQFEWMHFLILVPVVSFFALNFTGATPITSLSGVEKEIKYSVPVMLISAVTGLIMAFLP